MSHNMTPREGFTSFGSFFEFLMPFSVLFNPCSKRRAWIFLARHRASQDLQRIYVKIAYCEPNDDFSKKNMSIRSCTCSSNLTDFLLIRQEFVFFTEGGGKGLRHRRQNLVHVRLPSIFEKMVAPCWIFYSLRASQNTPPPFWHEENRKWILGATKRKISYCNIACHPSMNMYA